MSWHVNNPARYEGKVVATGHCVRFLQEAGGVPHTSHWRRGVKVRGGQVPTGTCIATFDPAGTYGNHTDGRSHACVLIGEVEDGLRVWDQWQGHAVAQRTIRWGPQPRASNNGDAFYVIEGPV